MQQDAGAGNHHQRRVGPAGASRGIRRRFSCLGYMILVRETRRDRIERSAAAAARLIGSLLPCASRRRSPRNNRHPERRAALAIGRWCRAGGRASLRDTSRATLQSRHVVAGNHQSCLPSTTTFVSRGEARPSSAPAMLPGDVGHESPVQTGQRRCQPLGRVERHAIEIVSTQCTCTTPLRHDAWSVVSIEGRNGECTKS